MTETGIQQQSHNGYIGKRRSGFVVILLSILTCSIYTFYWLYTVMEDINKASGEKRINSKGLLIGSFFCFPVLWIVYYKIDKGLSRLAQESGTFYRENFVMWLLLSFICGIGLIISDFQICGGLNEIWDKREGVTPQRY